MNVSRSSHTGRVSTGRLRRSLYSASGRHSGLYWEEAEEGIAGFVQSQRPWTKLLGGGEGLPIRREPATTKGVVDALVREIALRCPDF